MFRLEIRTDNAAFADSADGPMDEVRRILHDLTDQMDNDRAGASGTLRDINGNVVGEYEYTSES